MDIEHLPATKLLSDGTRLTIRPLRADEVRPFYDALTEAIRSNNGYGFDELPSFDYFARHYVDNFQNVVYELAETGQTVAFGNFGSSQFSRSAAPALVDGNQVILPEFRSRKWLRQIFILDLAGDVGVRLSCQGDTASLNAATIRVFTQIGFIVDGVLPKGIYFKDQGWTDLVLYYRPTMKLKM